MAVVLLLTTFVVPAANATDYSYWGLVNQVTSSNPMSYIQKLSSYEFFGRQTGFEGEKVTTDYIANHFKSIGLTPAGDNGTFFQNVPMRIVTPVAPIDFRQLDVNDSSVRQFQIKKDYNILHFATGAGNVKAQAIFCGYGLSSKAKVVYDDYAGIDVTGKIAIIFRGGPSFFTSQAASDPSLQSHLNFTTKVANAKSHGAKGVLLIENPTYPPERRNNLSLRNISITEAGLPGLYLTEETGDQVLAESGKTSKDIVSNIESQQKPYSFPLTKSKWHLQVTLEVKENYKSPNVVGYIPSSDPFGANETLLIGAHWDHLGVDSAGTLYPGAFDNASGVAVMMEVARVFATNKVKLNKNLAFAAFTGEEIALTGSTFMANNCPFPIEGLTMINLDMVGGAPNIIRCATDPYFEDLNSRLKQAALKVGADLKVSGPAMGASDHYPFYSVGVPAVFIIAADANVRYHQPEDTIDTVNAEGIQLVSKFVTHAASQYTDPFYLALDNPGPVSVGTPEYEITGYTGRNAKVNVGGRNTVASDTGRFVLTVPLTKGNQTVKVVSLKPGSAHKLEQELTVSYELRSKAVSSIAQVNFGYISKETKNEITFTISNKGEGPMTGTIETCNDNDWISISPKKLEPGETTVTAKVMLDRITEPGFHICMLEIRTDNGTLFVPVTAVSGNSLVALDLEMGSKKISIAGTQTTATNAPIAIGNVHYLPLSAISMAFGTSLRLDEKSATIALGTRKITVWPDTNIALIGNTPFKLEGNVYGKDNDFMIPVGMLDKLGIKHAFDEQNQSYHITFDATPFNITYKPRELKFKLDPANPNIDGQKIIIGTNRNSPAVFSTDSDWLYVWPTVGELGPFPFELNLKFATARLMQAGSKTANVKVTTDQGSFVIPVSVETPATERIVKIQIGSTTGTIDGVETKLSQPPFIDGGTTMVPYRFLGEAFGATIEWIAESKTVRATLGRTTVELVIGNKTAKINGIPTTMTKVPVIVKGSTFVPFRFIGEAFKAKVDWEQATKTITVTMSTTLGNPQLNVRPKEIELVWGDASKDKNPPITSVEARNEGQGVLQIFETNIFGSNITAEVVKDRVTISARYNSDGADTTETIFVKTNAGTEAVTVKVGIYPKEKSIARFNSDGSWFINGNRQNEAFKRTRDLISCSAMRMAGAAAGTSLFDGVANELTITATGHTLNLNVQSGDYYLDGTKMPWKFSFNLSETDVALPLAVYSLAFGWQIDEKADGTATVVIPRDKPSQLESNRKSIDLILDGTPKRMSSFTAPLYPLKNDKQYSFDDIKAKNRLFFFFTNNSESENIIPYVESIGRRYGQQGLESVLVSSNIISDMSVEQFLGGNLKIADGLSNLSIAGLTLPIIFDSDGIICQEFEGEAVPRLYIVDEAGNLLFELPEMNSSQIPYLEQAVASLMSGSTTLPSDVQTVEITNKGGTSGEGSLTPASPNLTVLQSKFRMAPTKVSVSFQQSAVAEETNLPAFKKASLTLLGNSNQQDIQARLWKLPKFSVFTTFSNGSDLVRFGKIWRKMPAISTVGEDPVCPVGEVITYMGYQLQTLGQDKALLVAGDKEIIITSGQSKVSIGADSRDFVQPFSFQKGVLFGPAKFLSEALGVKMYKFDETVCLVSQSQKASTTGPILDTGIQNLTFNNFIQPTGGYPPAPDFTLNNYPESTGKKTSLDDILNRKDVKVLVIDFWATWCPPCKNGMPYMEKMYRDYKDKGLALYGVIGDAKAVDDDYVATILEDDARIRGGLKKLGLDAITYPMLYENRTGTEVFRLYKGSSIPRVVVITKDKKWAFTKVGFWEIGHRNLEFTIRRLLGIEQSSKIPSITVKNTGVEELKGTVSVSLPYIEPEQKTFSTLSKTNLTFKFIPHKASKIPELGFITIDSNGGNQVIPFQYNPLYEQMMLEFQVDLATGETKVNNNKVNITVPTKTVGSKLWVAIDTVMSMLGGQTKILPDKKRAKSVFENWEILFVHQSKDISVGPITLKANENVIIENGHVYTDVGTMSYIVPIEYDYANENKTLILRYEP
jgi:thiol-disulfide isomerase/thioredoxin